MEKNTRNWSVVMTGKNEVSLQNIFGDDEYKDTFTVMGDHPVETLEKIVEEVFSVNGGNMFDYDDDDALSKNQMGVFLVKTKVKEFNEKFNK